MRSAGRACVNDNIGVQVDLPSKTELGVLDGVLRHLNPLARILHATRYRVARAHRCVETV
jgi:G3E family GTPase